MKLISVDLYFGSAYGKLATFSTGGNFEYQDNIFFKKIGSKYTNISWKTDKKNLLTEIMAMFSLSTVINTLMT